MPVMQLPPRAIVEGGLVPDPPKRVFYVAPEAGASGGDGTALSPWKAADVFNGAPAKAYIGSKIKSYSNELATQLPAGNASSPIQPGDGLILLPGDYGDLLIQGDFSQPAGAQLGYNNLSGVYGDGSAGAPVGFIWVSAHDGATLSTLKLSAFGWVIAGLKFRADLGSSDPNKSLCFLANRHGNVVVYGCDFAMAADASCLMPEEFLAKAPIAIRDYGGKANGDPEQPALISISGNLFRNVGNGVQTSRSKQVLIADNDIGFISFDGIDHGSWDIVIRGNKIHNRIDVGQSYHPDFIQHQPYGSQGSSDNCSNILIENNECLMATWPNGSVTPANICQGITQFDGEPTNYRVAYNRIVGCATQGIAVYGARGVVIEFNVAVLNDFPVNGAFPINIVKSKDGPGADDVEVRGNIAHSLSFDQYATNWRASDNLLIFSPGATGPGLYYYVDGVKQHKHQPGDYGYATVTAQTGADVFKTFNNPMGPYDLELK